MRKLTAYATTYDDDEYIERFDVTSDDADDLALASEDIHITRYSMEGPAARFDPVLGKNVVDMLKGDEAYPVEVTSAERRDNVLTITCGKISTRVKFDIEAPAWKLTRSDLVETVNEETARFSRHTYEGHGVSFGYRLFAPPLEPDERYPLVFALPGSGETGDKCGFDNNLQIADSRLALNFATDGWQAERPCYVLAPQFPSLEASYETSAYEDAWVELIGSLVETGQVDPNRIYAVTLSMGSRIMYSMLSRYPDFFAGLIINCGNPGGKSLAHLSNLPITLTHIENDCAVMTNFGKQAFRDLIAAGNRNVRFWLYPTEVVAEHGLSNSHMSWSLGMADQGNLTWLFDQRKEADASQPIRPVVETEGGITEACVLDGEVYVTLGALAATEGWRLAEDSRNLVVSSSRLGREAVVNLADEAVVASTVPAPEDAEGSFVRNCQGDCCVRYDFASTFMNTAVLVRFE